MDYSKNLYINKYKPKTLNEFKGNYKIKQTLINYLKTDNIPNILLTGDHGVGKSLIIDIFVKTYLPNLLYETAVIEIYGSLNRGKDIIIDNSGIKNKQKCINNNTVISFIKKHIILPQNKIKIVIIYEFHQMSEEAQMALRRIMEIYSNKVRFIIITNDTSKILQGIQSRCTPFVMERLNYEELCDILEPIIEGENLNKSEDLKKFIYLHSEGDIRVACNMLQIIGNKEHTNKDWYSILGLPDDNYIEEIIKQSIKNIQTYKLCKNILSQGHEINDIMNNITKHLIIMENFDKQDKFLKILAKNMITQEECNTEIQFYNFINKLCNE